jgi:hypothetical protein
MCSISLSSAHFAPSFLSFHPIPVFSLLFPLFFLLHSLPRHYGISFVKLLSYFLLYLDSLILSLLSCLPVSLSLSLSSTFIHLPSALLIFPLLHRRTRSSDSISLSPSSLCFLLFLLHSSLPSICLQTLPLSFQLSLSAYSSYTLSSLCNLAFPSSLLVPLSTSPCSFHPQISAPYINTLSIMLSNIIILLPEITSLLSLSYSPNTSHCLICFPQYLSDICRICGSFIECVTQNPSMYLFYFPFFPVPLIFFTLPLSFIKHHHFRLLNIHFLLLLPHILSQVLHHFFPFSFTLANARLQTFSLPTTLPPACTFFNSSSISATYIVNSRGLSEQPCLTPFVASNHSPSCSPQQPCSHSLIPLSLSLSLSLIQL